jgi:hypothetical protein
MTRQIVLGIGVVALIAVGGGLYVLRGIGEAIASAPAAEPLPFSVVEVRAANFAEARRARMLLASVAPVEPFDMVDNVMRIEVDLPLAGLRAALPDLVTDQGERFVVDAEDGRTATIQVHLAR